MAELKRRQTMIAQEKLEDLQSPIKSATSRNGLESETKTSFNPAG